MAETVVDVDFEVTLLTMRTTGPTGPAVHFCEPIGHRQADGDVLESWQPQQLSPAALDAAKSIGARIVNSLGGRGVFGVELLVRGDEVYFDNVRPRPVRQRPGDASLATTFGVRAACPRDPRAVGGHHHDFAGRRRSQLCRAPNQHRERTPPICRRCSTEALAVAESDVRLFGRPDETDTPRRLGVALATAPGSDRRQGPGPPGVHGAAQTLVTEPTDTDGPAHDGAVSRRPGNHCSSS